MSYTFEDLLDKHGHIYANSRDEFYHYIHSYDHANRLDPIDHIYFGSDHFKTLSEMSLDELVAYAERVHIQLEYVASPANYFKILRNIEFLIDEQVQEALLNYYHPDVNCRLTNDDGTPLDTIIYDEISPNRLVYIPESDSSSNCYDIVTLAQWFERAETHVNQYGRHRVTEYKDPLTNLPISPEIVHNILSNEIAWWVAYREDFMNPEHINVPYIPDADNPHKYKNLYQHADRFNSFNIIEIVNNQDYAKLDEILNNVDLDDVLMQLDNVNYRFSNGDTLMFLIITSPIEDKPDKIRQLVNKGANLDHIISDNFTALDLTTKLDNYELTALLLELGAHPDDKLNTSFIPLNNAIIQQNMDIINLLLDYGANPNISVRNHPTPLYLAIELDSPEVVRLLLHRGAKPHSKPNSPNPLILAIHHQNIEIIKLLLHYRVDLSVFDHIGRTPLVEAVKIGNSHIIKLLITSDRSAINVEGNYYGEHSHHRPMYVNPLTAAIKMGNIPIINLLIGKGANPNQSYSYSPPIYIAVEEGNMDVIMDIINHHGYVLTRDAGNSTLLIHAVKYNRIQAVKYLSQTSIDLDDHKNPNRMTALNEAAARGYIDAMIILLNAGAHREIANVKGNTPLLSAALHGHSEAVNILLDYHSHPNHQNHNGDTPLSFAARGGHLEMVKRLMAAGAHKHHRNNAGNTPLNEAIQNDHMDVANYLRSA